MQEREHCARQPVQEKVHPDLQSLATSPALANIGMFASAIAPRMGRADFAAFLKNSRRDWSSSFLFCFMIVPSCPIDSPDLG